eukprot:60813_1
MSFLSSLSWKKIGIIVIGNVALIGNVLYKLKQSNPSVTNGSIFTSKNICFGYIATSSALTGSMIGSYAQLSFFSNVPHFFPNNILNRFFPHSVDQNYSSQSKSKQFDARLLFKRLFLCGLFVFHHSIFARHSVKQWLSDKNIMSLRIERSIYVLLSNVLMFHLINNWNDNKDVKVVNAQTDDEQDSDDDDVLWQFTAWSRMPWYIQYGPFVSFLILGNVANMSVVSNEQFLGTANAFNVNFWIDKLKKNDGSSAELSVAGLYSMVRHPQMFFNILAFCMVPKMTVSRLTLTLAFFAYVMVGIQFEEKDLIKVFGDSYIEYQKQVPQLFPTWPLFKTVKL